MEKKHFRCKQCGKRSWFKPVKTEGSVKFQCPKCLSWGDFRYSEQRDLGDKYIPVMFPKRIRVLKKNFHPTLIRSRMFNKSNIV